MGCRPTAILYYGVVFEPDEKFPWNDELLDPWFIELLWADINGFLGDCVDLDEIRSFNEKLPCPVGTSACGTDGYLADIVGSHIVEENWEGGEVSIPELTDQEKMAVQGFIDKHCIPHLYDPKDYDKDQLTAKWRMSARYW